MPRILMLDETAVAERLSSDSSKNANIGSGAGSGRLTAAGIIFANANSLLADGRSVPASVNPSSGSVTLSQPFGTATISTIGGRRPAVTISGGINPAYVLTFPSCAAQAAPEFAADTAVGQFTIYNMSDNCGIDVTTNYCYI